MSLHILPKSWFTILYTRVHYTKTIRMIIKRKFSNKFTAILSLLLFITFQNLNAFPLISCSKHISVNSITRNSNYGTHLPNVIDVIPPVAICQNLTVQLDGSGSVIITAAAVNNGSTDNIGIASLVLDNTTFDCSDIGANTVTLTVTDLAGNQSTCTSTITVEDNIAPTPVCQNITVQLDALGNASITAEDIDNGSSDNCSISSMSLNETIFDCTNIGVNLLTLTITDNSGNSVSCGATVTLEDNVAPTIICLSDQNESLDNNCELTVPDYISTMFIKDNCTALPVITQVPVAGTVITTNTSVTISATDVLGNNSTCTFDILLSDNENPIISNCPSNADVFVDASCNYSILDYTNVITVTDNCDPAVTITQSPVAGTSLNTHGTIQSVTLTATDATGNEATCTFSISLMDNIIPTITCPANIITSSGAVNCNATIVIPAPVTNDNCGIYSLINDFNNSSNASDTYPVGVTTVVWTATDEAGNTATCSMTVEITDSVDPTISCPADVTANIDFGDCNAALTIDQPTYSDNCNVATITNDFNGNLDASDTYPIGTTTVIWTITDDSGNSTNCSMDITVIDNVRPTIACPGNQNVTLNGSCQYVILDYTGTTVVSDNCTVAPTVTQSIASGTIITSSTSITLTVTDDSGNSTQCTFIVIPVDNTAPTISCPPDVNVNFGN